VSRKPYIGPSDAQANAEALARRGLPYSAASGASFRVQWDWHRREPRDLREAVRMVRKAYADEVPTKLHDGPDAIGPDGTPRMTARAEGYIFGDERATDAPQGKCTCGMPPGAVDGPKAAPPPCTCGATSRSAASMVAHQPDCLAWVMSKPHWTHSRDCPRAPENQPLVAYYLAPFRATLANMERGDPTNQRRARMVQHVTFGSMGPYEAATAEGAHPLDAKDVAEAAIRAFLRCMSDLKLSVRNSEAAA
jgi:hypothetical protein